MTRRSVSLVALLLLLALTLRPRGPESVLAGSASRELRPDETAVNATADLLGETFVRSETQHFVILSDCGRAWTQARSALLERAYHQFERMMQKLDLPVREPESKMLCVFINDYEMYRAFARAQDGVTAPWVAGYYAAFSNRAVFFNDATSPSFAKALEESDGTPGTRRKLEAQAAEITTAKTLHEAIHLIAFNCGLQSRARQAPFWLTEGLASCFESENPSRAFGPDHPVPKRDAEMAELLADENLIPLEALVAMNAAPPQDDGAAAAMYAQSYALFRHLFRYERDTLAAYFRDLWAEPAGFISPRRHSEMFESRFGAAMLVEKSFVRASSREFAAADSSKE